MSEPWRHEGDWRMLVNTAAQQVGSIHDDEAARAVGFRRGFVPGSVVGSAGLPALTAAFGKAWFEGGWYRITFVSPVYVDEEVRELGERPGDDVAFQVVTRDGRLCANGRGGLGTATPWNEADDWTHGAEGVLAGVERGFDIGETIITPTVETTRTMVESSGETLAWYGESSPWGGPIVPPEHLMVAALHWVRHPDAQKLPPPEGVHGPGMWAEHDLVSTGPMLLGEPYRLREWVADKGRSGRTIYLTYGFEVLSGDRRVALGRHKAKWLAD